MMIGSYQKEIPSGYMWNNHIRIVLISVILCALGLSAISTGVVAQETPITVEESHQTELVGYDEGQDTQSHIIENNIELRFSGEESQNMVIDIKSGDHTVIDTDSINTFVEGESDVSLDVRYQSGEVKLMTDEVPEGTTVMIEFETVYIGGTTTNKADSAVLDVSYQTLGGTTSDESYPLAVDLSSTADNRINELQDSKGVSLLQQLFTYIGVGGVILLITVIGLKSAGLGGGDNDETLP
jgi:hypothetical protein